MADILTIIALIIIFKYGDKLLGTFGDVNHKEDTNSSTNETPDNASAFISPATLEALDII